MTTPITTDQPGSASVDAGPAQPESGPLAGERAALVAALGPFAARLRCRRALAWGWIGLVAGLAVAVVLVLAGRLIGPRLGLPAPAQASEVGDLALLGIAAALIPLGPLLGAVLGWGQRVSPWEAARVADALGLEERVTSALHATAPGAPARGRPGARRGSSVIDGSGDGPPAAALLLVADARRALDRIDPAAIAATFRPTGRLARLGWRLVAGLALALVAVTLVPLPVPGDARQAAVERQAVAAARRSVEALARPAAPPDALPPLERATADELRALDAALAQASSAAEAARSLEAAQERLATLATPENYAARRAAENLAATLSGRGDLDALARALGRDDPAAIERAVAELAARTAELTPEQREQRKLALQAAANAVRDNPELAAALRQAAAEAAAAGGEAGRGEAGSGESATEALAPLLAQNAARSAALRSVQAAMSGVGQARAALGTALAQAGAASASAAGASGRARAGAAGAAGGATSGAICPTGNCPGGGSSTAGTTGASDGTGTTTGAAGGSGSGQGGGSGSGSGGSNGTGGSGQGAGGRGGAGGGTGPGAGAGGGPTPGQPGGAAPASGYPTGSGGPARGQGAPNDPAVGVYGSVYAPSLLGGSGPVVQAPGESGGTSGQTVELPESPLELGAIRPYREVYEQYEAAARQALARQPLPPALQSAVQRYFSAIDPRPEAKE